MTKAITVHTGVLVLVLAPLIGCGPDEPVETAPEATATPLAEPETPAPSADEQPTPQAEPPASAPATYAVQAGDHLWGIAGRESVYDASRYWPLLYDGNRQRIEDPDLIYTGWELDIPRFESEAKRRDRLFELWRELDDAG